VPQQSPRAKRAPAPAASCVEEERADAFFPLRATDQNCASTASTSPSDELYDEVRGFHARLREQLQKSATLGDNDCQCDDCCPGDGKNCDVEGLRPYLK
jgi:hypothetical protein